MVWARGIGAPRAHMWVMTNIKILTDKETGMCEEVNLICGCIQSIWNTDARGS